MARGAKRAAADAEPVKGPWELPVGWRWERLQDVAEVNPRTDLDLPSATSVPFVRMAAVEEETGKLDPSQHRPAAEVARGFTRFREGDVLFAKITPCMENGKIAEVPAMSASVGAGSTEFHVVRSGAFARGFLLYYLIQRSTRQEAERNMKGSAGQRRVPTDYLRLLPVPVPPRDVQRRIVARIEELFAEIDDGDAALAATERSLEEYRLGILRSAVSGVLSTDVRGRSGEIASGPLPEAWMQSSMGEVADIGTGSTPTRSNPLFWTGGEIPWLTSSCVGAAVVSAAEQFVTPAAVQAHRLKTYPAGTLLLALYGEGKTRGNSTVLRVPATINQALAAIRPKDGMPVEWLKLVLDESYQRNRADAAGGVQPNLNLAKVGAIRVPIPPRDEMRVLLSRVATALTQAFELREELAAQRQAVLALRQSIFAAAFRGDLAA
jgi:type I restriction enzyme S subunit